MKKAKKKTDNRKHEGAAVSELEDEQQLIAWKEYNYDN